MGTTMPCCIEWCCYDCCQSPECNCRWGESFAWLGSFVFVAAIAFLGIGYIFQVCFPYGPAWNDWYHPLNMWFFKLSGFLIVFGAIYAACSRQTKAFAREPLFQVDDGEHTSTSK